jgi:hypothetical protein
MARRERARTIDAIAPPAGWLRKPLDNSFNFHPALAAGPRSGQFANFSLVGRDATHTMTAGMVMQKIGGKWYVLCSRSPAEGPPAGGHYDIYDLNMRFAGFLNAPLPNEQHPASDGVRGAGSRDAEHALADGLIPAL